MTKKISNLPLWTLAVALAGLAGCAGEKPAPPPEETAQPAAEPETPTGTPVAVVETSRGSFTIELLPDVAPQTVENFIRLAKAGFWYNTTFHRVIPGTLIQGGDPNSKDNNPYNDGQGNSGTFLPAEFSKLPFEKGTVAMARQESDTNSASCQFFVSLQRNPQWDGKYTVFGKVIDGIDLVDELSRSPLSKDKALRNYPAGKIQIKRVRIEYREGK